jgi:hypothetical protein
MGTAVIRAIVGNGLLGRTGNLNHANAHDKGSDDLDKGDPKGHTGKGIALSKRCPSFLIPVRPTKWRTCAPDPNLRRWRRGAGLADSRKWRNGQRYCVSPDYPIDGYFINAVTVIAVELRICLSQLCSSDIYNPLCETLAQVVGKLLDNN